MAACGSDDDDDHPVNRKPGYIGEVSVTTYDGGADDLLTAGLGKEGLAGPAPVPANPAAPTR
ncbi:hypothetical protein HP442_28615, partial [Klebsiella pneumoniae]|nr:hypothetical protein [Klebsiella pneumoniae]